MTTERRSQAPVYDRMQYMQGIIYTRVSSDEQVKGTSLDSQEQACREFCARNGIAVLELFRDEGASAKSANRPELLRALEYCRKQKGKVEAFVVAKVDRFARNADDHFYVSKLLRDYGVSLRSVSEPIGSSPTGRFVETMLAATSEFDNAIRRQRSSDGVSARISQGLWPFKAPLGYVSYGSKKRGEKELKPDPIDPVLFPIIQRGLKEYATGRLRSLVDLARFLDNAGLEQARGARTPAQFADRITGRLLPFYAGQLRNAWTGETVLGQHEAMISLDEMQRIRLIRSGKMPTQVRNRSNPEYPLRRTVLCGLCRRSLTGSRSRGRSNCYAYYHCPNRGCTEYGKTISKGLLEDSFVLELERVTPTQNALTALAGNVSQCIRRTRQSLLIAQVAYQRRADELTDRRSRIFDMREDGSYGVAEFRERLAIVDQELAAAAQSMHAQACAETEREVVVDGVFFLTDLRSTWLKLAPELRDRFQQLVFPEGIPYVRKQGFGTAKLGPILALCEQFARDESLEVTQRGVYWNHLRTDMEKIKELIDAIEKETNDDDCETRI